MVGKAKSLTVDTGENQESSKDQKTMFSAVDSALKQVRVWLQTTEKLETLLNETALKCLKHAQEFGDVMPADRFLKGLREMKHRDATRLAGEIMVYLVALSPIRWNKDGQPRQAKESDKDYRPYDIETAEKTPFYQMQQIEESRKAAEKAANRVLSGMTAESVMNGLRGLVKRIEQVRTGEPDSKGNIKKFARGQKKEVLALEEKIQEFIDSLENSEEEDKEAA